jgi:ribosome biogenesis protein BMS1
VVVDKKVAKNRIVQQRLLSPTVRSCKMSGLSDLIGSKTKSKPSKTGKLKGNAGSNGRKNPKAFSVANVVRTKRTMQRNLDRSQKKEVIPLTNREEELPPPALVVVMGPKGCGKSTLIRSLVKIYSGQNMADTVGPITVVAGRKRRITLFECPLDLYSMTDLAKVADLVLVMVDASYGFEMETFEYLNLLQLHGFPKVMGVMTNLDKFKANKTLQNAKKAIKHRFWTEIYKGAKMFEFMGVVNGKYRKHEVKRLSLYVSRVKFRPLVWRNTHPYVVVDRVEDVTPIVRDGNNNTSVANANSTDREVTLYGYVRGSHLKPSMKMHLIGAGDFDISAISSLPDPCPLPHNSGGIGSTTNGKCAKSKQASCYFPGLFLEIQCSLVATNRTG